MKILLVISAVLLSGCATTTHKPMKGVFHPHFKSEFENKVFIDGPNEIKTPVLKRIKIAGADHE